MAALTCFTVAAHALRAEPAPFPDESEKARIDRLIVYYSARYHVPVELARKVVQSESEYRPLARNGPYWGLMQIRYDTARGMGYRGPAKGLLDAETNLAFGVAYLANSLKVAGGNPSRGHMLYRKGYYYEARRKRVLDDLIIVRDFNPVGQSATLLAVAEPMSPTGDLWSGDAASAVTAVAMAAPLPRARPATIVAEVAEPPSVAPAKIAAEPVKVATGPAVAQPTVVYASVLPLPRPAPLVKIAPPVTASIVVASSDPVDPPVQDPIPLPRHRPVVVAVATDAPPAAPKSPLEIALEAAAAREAVRLATAKGTVAPPLEAQADATVPPVSSGPMVVATAEIPAPRHRPAAISSTVAVITPEPAAQPVVLVAQRGPMPLPRLRPAVLPASGRSN